MFLKRLFALITLLDRGYQKYVLSIFYRHQLGYCGKNVIIKKPLSVSCWNNIYLYDNTNILWGFTFISNGGKFIMKNGSGAAQGLTVITGNHVRISGSRFKNDQGLAHPENDVEKDVIVEEDVWIGANVTLLAGITIGRCATIGAGSVCIKSVPPYAMVMGNPAKIVGFVFNPDEIVEHEKSLFPEKERLTRELVERNYDKYFLKKVSEIKEYTKL